MSLKGNCAGFDFGDRNLHIAIREGGRITRVINEPMPDGLVRDAQILSFEAMSDFLKEVRRQYKISPKTAALVLPEQACYCRRFITAYMSASQLNFNLPYEFRDFISGEKEDYFYDYAVVETIQDEEGKPKELDLMAAAVDRMLIHDYMAMFRRAGFTLKTAVPEEMAYINLLRIAGEDADPHGHCILDLGHNAVRLLMYTGDRFDSVHAMDFGLNALDQVIADNFGVDVHVAGSYRESNYEDCLALPGCQDIYNRIGIEVLKSVNFYRFSNQGEELTHLHCCGGGVKNQPLLVSLQETLELPVLDLTEFWPGMADLVREEAALAAAAAGATMQ